MMKKVFTITLALCSVLMAMACSSNDPEESNMTGGTEQNGEEAAKGKMLVIYFSRAGENWEVGNVEHGNTAIMVDYIQEYADVDVFEIVYSNRSVSVAAASVMRPLRPLLRTG